MSVPAQATSVGFSLAAVLCWGTSDFVGGYASKKANAVLITAITNGSGLVAIVSVAILSGSHMPTLNNIAWALVGGACGGTALAVFYRALAAGNMGLTAPISAILSAAIPALFGMFVQGLPPATQIAGFILAAFGILLISRSDQSGSPRGLGLAVISGIGFAGFYICAQRAGTASALWLATATRVAAFVCTAGWVLATKSFKPARSASLKWGVLAGVIDVSGSVLFFRSLQTGRLDTAVVLASLYPVITVLLARIVLKERFSRWKVAGMVAALAAVPLIAS
jgi:drug/metabolite transporter (DMT)-like permease